MNKERYKYTPDIEQISDFADFSPFEKDISFNKANYTENDFGYSIFTFQGEICQGIATINFRYPENKNCKVENTVQLATNSRLKLILRHHRTSNVRIKDSLTVILGENAHLEIIEIVETNSTILSEINVTVEKGSSATLSILDLNNTHVIRNQYINLVGENSECTLNGLYITNEKEHVDNFVKINHAVSNCVSNQLFKGVLSGESSTAFTGHIYIAKDAQRIAAYQQNHNILLSDNAKANSRPQLEIYADDVKCSHGATVGKLDPEATYYMRQRGIPVEKARKLQLVGFAADILESDTFDDIKSEIHQKITDNLR